MTELLDVYDANKKYIGVADRNVVHKFGLWHKVIHCWIVIKIDNNPMLVFQRRTRNGNDVNAGKLYATAGGHLSAGETLEQAFKRETTEEIGLPVNDLQLKLLSEGPWVGDIKKNDGSIFSDRVFFSEYYAFWNGQITDFKFNDGEVDSIVAIKLTDMFNFINYKTESVSGIEFDGKNIVNIALTEKDFARAGDESVQEKHRHNVSMICKDLDI
ncbi:MAG: NUDIX domain-containing protein [Rickettsiales bacterium]|jgi:8-oxo-dGTP pyrophosphatase MutT (NUDIX family)|nr:NUDIX domain-containing protein [Rickettsiales bacterium]